MNKSAFDWRLWAFITVLTAPFYAVMLLLCILLGFNAPESQ